MNIDNYESGLDAYGTFRDSVKSSPAAGMLRLEVATRMETWSHTHLSHNHKGLPQIVVKS